MAVLTLFGEGEEEEEDPQLKSLRSKLEAKAEKIVGIENNLILNETGLVCFI